MTTRHRHPRTDNANRVRTVTRCACGRRTESRTGTCIACHNPTIPDAEAALTGGQWVPIGGIMRWCAGEEPAAEVAARFDFSTLIACPTCAAKVTQSCRTTSGYPAKAHRARITSRRCPCGARAPSNAILCEPCRLQARRDSWRAAQRRLRARRRDQIGDAA